MTWYNCINIFNPFGDKLLFLCVCSVSLFKILSEEEKLLVTSNFSFSHRVFYYFLPFSSNLELSSANSFSLEESKICRLGKGLYLKLTSYYFNLCYSFIQDGSTFVQALAMGSVMFCGFVKDAKLPALSPKLDPPNPPTRTEQTDKGPVEKEACLNLAAGKEYH